MKKVTLLLTSLAIVLGVGAVSLSPVTAFAYNPLDSGCTADPNSPICKDRGKSNNQTANLVQNIINTLLYALGIICVIMIIIGGIRYALSDGDSSKITNAKNTVLYAVVGLVVALLAFGIVNFVINRIG